MTLKEADWPFRRILRNEIGWRGAWLRWTDAKGPIGTKRGGKWHQTREVAVAAGGVQTRRACLSECPTTITSAGTRMMLTVAY